MIDGVEFKVVASEPPEGLVMLNTILFANGAPLQV